MSHAGVATARSRHNGAWEGEVREGLLAEVATLYYVDRLTQKQIARRLGRSVATVSRLLAEAKSKAIVEVRVQYPVPVVPELQAALVKRFRLRLARVARVPPDEPHTLLPQLGELAARFLAAKVRDGDVISVGWGAAMYETIRLVKVSPHQDVRVVQGIGSLGSERSWIDNPLLARVLAERLGGTAHALPAPMMVESRAVRDALARDSQFQEALDLWGKSNIGLFGIGLTDPEHAGLCRAGYLDASAMERIRASGVVGDIMGEFFDIHGRIQATGIGDRIMGMRLPQLRKVGTVIAVAGGSVKAPAILGALRSGLVHVLVTDYAAARKVLELDDAFPL